MIDTNGEIMPCYRSFEALRFPSLYDEDGVKFKDVFNSPGYQQLRKTANTSKEDKKYYAYCGKCEFRYGWDREESHLGDETWIDSMREAGKLIDIKIDHRRPLKGTAGKKQAIPDAITQQP